MQTGSEIEVYNLILFNRLMTKSIWNS